MSVAETTATVLVATVAFLIVYDIWAKRADPSGNGTISWVTRVASKSYPIVACAIGVVIGHILWPNCPVCG